MLLEKKELQIMRSNKKRQFQRENSNKDKNPYWVLPSCFIEIETD